MDIPWTPVGIGVHGYPFQLSGLSGCQVLSCQYNELKISSALLTCARLQVLDIPLKYKHILVGASSETQRHILILTDNPVVEVVVGDVIYLSSVCQDLFVRDARLSVFLFWQEVIYVYCAFVTVHIIFRKSENLTTLF